VHCPIDDVSSFHELATTEETRAEGNPMSNPVSPEVEQAKAMVEQAGRELCQARGQKPPEFQWELVADAPQRLRILIEGLPAINLEFKSPGLTEHGGMAAARMTRRAILDASRAG
jgi:hypothetical protein